MRTLTTELGGLQCRVVDGGDPAATPDLIMVMCHGYGAPGHDLVGIGSEILRAFPALAGRVRFVFPAAPHRIPGMEFMEARAWWQIDVGRFERALASGAMSQLRKDVPEGLAPARRSILSLLDELQRQSGLPMSRIVLGGFSQGAMLTTDVALRLDEGPAGLAVFSGTLMCEAEWRRTAPRRRGLPVLQTHGRQDPLLPFVAAEWLRDLLESSGLAVSFLPFDGPHTIAADGIVGLAQLLAGRLEALAAD